MHVGAFGWLFSAGLLLIATGYKLVWDHAEAAPFHVAWMYLVGALAFGWYLLRALHCAYPEPWGWTLAKGLGLAVVILIVVTLIPSVAAL